MPSRLIPNYDKDIFINYARFDNDLEESDRGWVDTLYERLKKRLRALTGIDPEIFIDTRDMKGNGHVTDTLIIKMQRVALLVPILSPCYLKSDWCIQEVSEFCRHAAETGELQVDNKSRVFKVIKTPIDEVPCPPELKQLPGYEFYGVDSRGRIREFKHLPRYSNFVNFVDKSDDLAVDIKDFVKDCVSLSPRDRTVYLATTIAELTEERESIRRELKQHGYRVLPEKLLPTDGPKFREAVSHDLEQSRLSVHLLGGESGFIPAGEKRDIGYLQHALALERQAGSNFFRIVWTPMGLKVHGAAQQKFIKYLRTQPKAQQGAELLLGNVKREDLKKYILEKLKTLVRFESDEEPLAKAPEASPGDDGLSDEPVTGRPAARAVTKDPVCVYLICDKKDFNSGAFVPLRDYLIDVKGYNVTLPVMDGTTRQSVAEHNRNLSECDVAIIFYGQPNEGWVRLKLNELKKAVANGRSKPQPITAVYIDGPVNNIKDFYRDTPEYRAIKDYGEFSPEALEPLLEAIQQSFSSDKRKGAAG